MNIPELKPVVSSQVAAIGYDESNQILFVKFPANSKNPLGSLYAYDNVPADVWAGFEAAASVGSFFGSQIRGKYTFTKLPVMSDTEE